MSIPTPKAQLTAEQPYRSCNERTLDGFQKVMLRWEEIRPYNAVHAIRFPADFFTAEKLSESISSVLKSAGLSAVRFDKSRNSAAFLSGENPISAQRLVASEACITELMTNQLNVQYSKADDCPFRFQLVDHHSAAGKPDGQTLIVGYRHAIADAQTIVLLLKQIVDHYRTGAVTGRNLTCHAPSLQTLFASETGIRSLLPRTQKLVSDLILSLRCYRPQSNNLHSTQESCCVHPVQVETSKLKSAAKKYDARVQDFLMAALVDATGEVFGRSSARQLAVQRRLAVTSMIDLRRYADGSLDRTIGQFLGILAVRPRRNSVTQFSDLIAQVKQQNDTAIRRREFLWAINSMNLMAKFWDMLPLSINRNLARQLYPFTCALSNVHLSAPIATEIQNGFIKNYFRAANLGVLVPMVLSNTTVGDHVNFCTTRKDAYYSEEEVRQIVDCVVRRINRS